MPGLSHYTELELELEYFRATGKLGDRQREFRENRDDMVRAIGLQFNVSDPILCDHITAEEERYVNAFVYYGFISSALA